MKSTSELTANLEKNRERPHRKLILHKETLRILTDAEPHRPFFNVSDDGCHFSDPITCTCSCRHTDCC